MQKAIAYLRVSTEDQRDNNSLELQQAACQFQASQLGLKKILFFTDVISGFSFINRREGLLKAINALKENDVFIAYHRDRLARKGEIVVNIEQAVSNKKAKLIIVLDGNHPSDGLMNHAIDVIAQRKIIEIRNTTKRSLETKKKRKEITGNIPLGYAPAKNGINIKKDADEQKAIKLIIKLRKRGDSYKDIAATLAIKNFTNRHGNLYTTDRVGEIYRDLTKEKQEQPVKVSNNPPYGLKESTLSDEEIVVYLVNYFRNVGKLSLRQTLRAVNELKHITRISKKSFYLTQIYRIDLRLRGL